MYNPTDYELAIDDVPTWMRPRYRGIDWTLWATLALCVCIMLPLLSEPSNSLPRSPHAEMHMYRILEVSESIQEGVLYPRWASDFNYGYGSPIFNHLAPLPHYIGALYVVLTQNSPISALRFVLILAIFLCGVSTMGFVRQRWGELAGFLAAAVLLFSPYLTLTGPYLETDISGLWALGLFMSTLWILDRTFLEGRGRNIPFLALSSGALLLADNGLSPLLFVLVLMWATVNTISHYKTYHCGSAVIGLLLGIGIASIHYLPAISEQDAVQWEALPVYPDAIDTSQLFDPIPRLDQAAFNPIPIPYLGVASWLLASIGTIWLLVRISRRQLPDYDISALFFLPVGAILIIALLSPSAEWWGSGFESLQPTDVLGLLTACCAILAGQIPDLFDTYFQRLTSRFAAIGIVTAILATSAANTLYTPEFISLQRPVTTNQHLNSVELRGQALSTIRNGHLLPADIRVLPEPSRSLYSTSDLERVEKLEPQSLPVNTRIAIISHSSTHDEFSIESPEEQSITILTFNYPGWTATRNNEEIPITSTPQDGLISLKIEQGLNEIELSFDNTAVRTTGWLVASIALVGSIIYGYILERLQPDKPTPGISPLALKMRQQRHWLASVILLSLVTMNTVVRLNPEMVTRQTQPNNVPAETYLMDLIVQGGISFLGYRYDQLTPLDANEIIFLTTYWSAEGTNVNNYQIRLSLIAEDGQTVWQQEYRHITNWPTRRWPHEGYILGTYAITAPEQPGRYEVVIELGPCDRVDLHLCPATSYSEVYDVRSGSIDQKIVLPQPVIVQQP